MWSEQNRNIKTSKQNQSTKSVWLSAPRTPVIRTKPEPIVSMGGTYIEINKEIPVIEDYSSKTTAIILSWWHKVPYCSRGSLSHCLFYAGTFVKAPCNLARKDVWRSQDDVLLSLGPDALFEGKKNNAQFSVVSTPTGMEVFPPLPHDRLSLQRPFSVADHGRSVEKNCKNSHKKRKWGGSAYASALCEVCLRPSNPALLPAVNHQGPSNDCPCVVSKDFGGPTVVQGLSKHVQWLGRELSNYAFIVCDLQAFLQTGKEWGCSQRVGWKRDAKKSLQGRLSGRETPDFVVLTADEHDRTAVQCVHVNVSEVHDNCGFAYAGRGQIMNLSQISCRGSVRIIITVILLVASMQPEKVFCAQFSSWIGKDKFRIG